MQYVKIEQQISESFPVLTGVSQACHLESLLFIIFVNDIVNVLQTSRCLMYIDDIEFFIRSNH